jgi:hypothetical protein
MNDTPQRTPVAVAPAMALGESLMRLLADPQISGEKLKMLLDMQREIMADAKREAFDTAFAGMAMEMPQVEKRGNVELIRSSDGKKLGSYKYLKFEDLEEVVRPIRHKWGFGMTFYPGSEDGKPVLYGELLHTSGHSKRGFLPLIPDRGPGRNDLQAEGSALSYLKRYLTELLCNIVRKGVDDDGIKAGLLPISKDQVKELSGLLGEISTKTATFLNLFITGVEKLEDIPAREYPRLLNAAQQKKAQLLKDKNKASQERQAKGPPR